MIVSSCGIHSRPEFVCSHFWQSSGNRREWTLFNAMVNIRGFKFPKGVCGIRRNSTYFCAEFDLRKINSQFHMLPVREMELTKKSITLSVFWDLHAHTEYVISPKLTLNSYKYYVFMFSIQHQNLSFCIFCYFLITYFLKRINFFNRKCLYQ